MHRLYPSNPSCQLEIKLIVVLILLALNAFIYLNFLKQVRNLQIAGMAMTFVYDEKLSERKKCGPICFGLI